jgi:hypothetical protein
MKREADKIRWFAVAVLMCSWCALANVPQEVTVYASDHAAEPAVDSSSKDARYVNQTTLEQGLLLPSQFDSESRPAGTDRVKSATEIVEAAQARVLATSRPRAYWLVWLTAVWVSLALLSRGWSLREAAEHRHLT